MSFDQAPYDESAMAREECRRADAHFTEVLVTQESLAADFNDAVWHGETLSANAHGVAKFALSRAARDAGIKVVLTGEGADEMLGGYPAFVKDSIRHGSDGEREAFRSAIGVTADASADLLRPHLPAEPPSSFMKTLGNGCFTGFGRLCPLPIGATKCTRGPSLITMSRDN